ncbi:Copia protein [Cucumis melo var. makuwa]|uniref:Copia protein n=1 Tax=Cucumis melo var. makuwa TaxID=1194695 RepID=A0A5A7TIN5_CUCMM|nr:Copia protein [Cucumis melo var. makuwa]
MKVSKAGKITMLIVYVDAIILSGDDTAEIIQLKKKMGDEFEIEYLGSLKYFLGIEVLYEEQKEAVNRILRNPPLAIVPLSEAILLPRGVGVRGCGKKQC